MKIQMKIEEHTKLSLKHTKLSKIMKINYIRCTNCPNLFPNLKSSNVQNRENSI